jgi:hypothetical protein
MMRACPAMVQAETVAAVPALRRRAGWNCPGHRVGWAMDHNTIPVHVTALLYKLS